MLSTYKTKDDFLSGISARISSPNSDMNIRTAVLAGIAEADDELRVNNEGDQAQALHLKVGSWVIRDDDLPLLDGVNATSAAITASMAAAGLSWPAIATAVTAIAQICWRAWRKGARLTSRQVSVYGFLRAHGPIRLAPLTAALKKQGEDFTEKDVTSILKSLAELEMNDGQIVALAKQDDDNAWKALKI